MWIFQKFGKVRDMTGFLSFNNKQLREWSVETFDAERR